MAEALAQEKMLYQNNPSKVNEIEQQQQALFIGLTNKEIEQAQLGAADKNTLYDALAMISGPAMVKDFAGLIGTLRAAKGVGAAIDSAITVNSGAAKVVGASSAAGVPEFAQLRSDLKALNTSEFSTAEKGVLGEARGSLVYQRAGYQELPARLSSNQGFDGVFVKYGADGGPIDIIINESKCTSTGRTSLSNTNMGKQMSSACIDENIQKMMNHVDTSVMETGFFLDANRSIIRTKANVLNPQGVNRWNILNLPE